MSIAEIRELTRIALPEDDDYLYRLGVALYGFSSISSFMAEIICLLDSEQNRIKLASDATSGDMLNLFRQTRKKLKSKHKFIEIHSTMQDTADMFEKLNTERTDFVHAYPITGTGRQQILHRRKDEKDKYFEVTNEFLDDFILRLDEVNTKLYKIRDIVRSVA
jgi:hypothetical protein